jgi:glycosyltransferase involved in cell wall biosynthesis
MDVTGAPGREGWKVTVVVPALDEEATIAEVLAGVRPFADELLVVDGGSRDRTRALAAAAGVPVLSDDGSGKGAALRVGLAAARHPIVVFIDADGSHEPADIPKLAAAVRRAEAEIAIGCWGTGGSDELFGTFSQFIRLTGSMVINLAINYRWDVRLSDTQNGFRAVDRDAVRALALTEDGTTIEQEMVMKALARGLRVANLASHEYQRRGGASKVIVSRVWPRYVWNVLRHVLRPGRRAPRSG